MITKIRKRNNEIVPFQSEKITWAIFKAATAVGGDDFMLAQKLSDLVVETANSNIAGDIADVEEIQDIVEKSSSKAGTPALPRRLSCTVKSAARPGVQRADRRDDRYVFRLPGR